jgi:hypothetical protein
LYPSHMLYCSDRLGYSSYSSRSQPPRFGPALSHTIAQEDVLAEDIRMPRLLGPDDL